VRTEARIPFFLIARHVMRGSKWTLALIIFLVSIAFINLVFITSLFNGIIDNSNQQIINTSTGHVSITPREGHDFIGDTDAVLAKIKDVDGVKAASAQMIVSASLKYKNIKGSWRVLAINPSDEKKVTNVSQRMIKGSYLNPDDTDKIIIGRQIAGGADVEMNAFSFKGARVGDTVTLSFDNVKRDFKIKGIFYTKFIETDERAFITQKALEQLAPYYDGKATSIVIRIDKEGKEDSVISTMKSRGIDESFYTWKDLAGLMKTVTKSFLSINALLSFVGLLIAAVTIFIVIYIDISNKRQQIGILRAIGIKPYLIRATYVLQTVIYSVSGVLLGTGLFFSIIVPYFRSHPFQLPIGDAVLVINYADFVIRAEAVILVALLSGLIPAILVTRAKLLDEILGK